MAVHLLNLIIAFKGPNVHWKDNLHMLCGGAPLDTQVKCACVCCSFQNMVVNLTRLICAEVPEVPSGTPKISTL